MLLGETILLQLHEGTRLKVLLWGYLLLLWHELMLLLLWYHLLMLRWACLLLLLLPLIGMAALLVVALVSMALLLIEAAVLTKIALDGRCMKITCMRLGLVHLLVSLKLCHVLSGARHDVIQVLTVAYRLTDGVWERDSLTKAFF